MKTKGGRELPPASLLPKTHPSFLPHPNTLTLEKEEKKGKEGKGKETDFAESPPSPFSSQRLRSPFLPSLLLTWKIRVKNYRFFAPSLPPVNPLSLSSNTFFLSSLRALTTPGSLSNPWLFLPSFLPSWSQRPQSHSSPPSHTNPFFYSHPSFSSFQSFVFLRVGEGERKWADDDCYGLLFRGFRGK